MSFFLPLVLSGRKPAPYSRDLASLLTRLTFCACLKPFLLTQPFCNCFAELGEKGLELISGGVTPSFFGVNSSVADYKNSLKYQQLTLKELQQMIIVDLDNSIIDQTVSQFKERAKLIPKLLTRNRSLRYIYLQINNQYSRHFQLEGTVRGAKKQFSQQNCDLNQKNVLQIFNILRTYFEENIISYLNLEIIYNENQVTKN